MRTPRPASARPPWRRPHRSSSLLIDASSFPPERSCPVKRDATPWSLLGIATPPAHLIWRSTITHVARTAVKPLWIQTGGEKLLYLQLYRSYTNVFCEAYSRKIPNRYLKYSIARIEFWCTKFSITHKCAIDDDSMPASRRSPPRWRQTDPDRWSDGEDGNQA